MKKLTLTAFIVLCLFANSYSQNKSFYNKWNLKLGYYNYELEKTIAREKKYMHNITVDAGYNINKVVGFGGMLGYGIYKEYLTRKSDGRIYTSNGPSSSLLYGVKLDIQLLPFVIKKGGARIDVYMSYKLGGNYKFASKGAALERGHYFEYATFLGASYYFGRHFGLFVEGGYSNTSRMRYGLAYKF